MRLAPDCHKHILDDVLGRIAVQRLNRDSEDPCRVPAVELTQCLVLTRGEALHQRLIGRLSRWGWSGDLSHIETPYLLWSPAGGDGHAAIMRGVSAGLRSITWVSEGAPADHLRGPGAHLPK